MEKEDNSLQFEYPNGTLKNKLNILDREELAKVEYRTVAHEIEYLFDKQQDGLISKVKTLDSLADLHRFLFGTIYSWAGQFRNYYLSKGDTDFMPPEAFDSAIRNINQQLNRIHKSHYKPSRMQYAQLLDSINYLHPFREGNGRVTRVFLNVIGAQHNQYLDYSRNNKMLTQGLITSDIKLIANQLIVEEVNNPHEAINKQLLHQFQQHYRERER